MWMTPAPASTALVAASICSGTGEVNTSPGQAASSMPWPTNPPCSGSRAGPPARDPAPLPRHGRVGPGQDLRVGVVAQDRRMRGRQAGQRLLDDIRGVVEEL